MQFRSESIIKIINTFLNWCYKFLKRNMLTFHEETHISQKQAQFKHNYQNISQVYEKLRWDNDKNVIDFRKLDAQRESEDYIENTDMIENL